MAIADAGEEKKKETQNWPAGTSYFGPGIPQIKVWRLLDQVADRRGRACRPVVPIKPCSRLCHGSAGNPKLDSTSNQ